MSDAEAFFVEEGDEVRPTWRCRGPWDPDSAHGGPVAALVVRAVERFEPEPRLFPARLTVELLRPVPLAPLRLETTMRRPGRRVQLVDVTVAHDDRPVVSASALRVQRPPAELGDLPDDGDVLPPPEGLVPHAWERQRAGIGDAVELRPVRGEFTVPGPAAYWVRLLVPLVPGEEPSPAQRTMVAADFGNGISQVLDIERHVYINPELTVHLHREPRGEWIGLAATTRVEPGHGAYAEGALYDVEGRIGRSAQSLFVDAR